MHILFLTDNFPPEVNAPASRTFEHCKVWVEAGHQVTIITCAPNFPKGRVFEGYRNKLWQQETMSGIRVIRVWTYITANEGFLRRTLDYVSFMIGASIAALFVRKVDLVIGTSPQFFTACAAWFVGALKRRPFVFELRDLWPESIKAVGAMRETAVFRILVRVEMFLYRRAALIVSVTHSFKKILSARGISAEKIAVITNAADLSRFAPTNRETGLEHKFSLQGRFVAGYVGTHGLAHALETVLDAAAILQLRPDADRYRILLLGDGANKQALIARANELELRNILFIDSVPKDQVAAYWSLLDISIIHLRKTELFTTVIPSKLFEGMAMGLPVILGVAGESADIVKLEDVGIPITPENAVELAEGIVRLSEDSGLRSRYRSNCLAAAKKYNRTTQAAAMLALLVDTGKRKSQKSGL